MSFSIGPPLARGTARPPSPQMRSRSLVSSRRTCTTDAPQHHLEPALYRAVTIDTGLVVSPVTDDVEQEFNIRVNKYGLDFSSTPRRPHNFVWCSSVEEQSTFGSAGRTLPPSSMRGHFAQALWWTTINHQPGPVPYRRYAGTVTYGRALMGRASRENISCRGA